MTRIDKMAKIEINEVAAILDDLMPDEETAKMFGISYMSHGEGVQLMVRSTKSKDEEEDNIALVGTTEKFGQTFYVYQCL